jgi:hypothetical protein
MLTESTIAMLSALTYRAGAAKRVCVLPLGGIYWDDELPELRELSEIPQCDHAKTRCFLVPLRTLLEH